MTEAEIIKATYFMPWHIILYLFVVFVITVVFCQWRWANICDNNIQVLVAQQGGGGAFFLAPKTGGQVTINNSRTDETRTWPMNELATIEIPYPGVGFVPSFLQKTIRLAIVNEGDWEPMLNRSPHRENVASPDIVEYLKGLGESINDADKKAEIALLVKGLATGPTREMIADPAILGNLMRSSVMKALATVSNELVETLNNVNAKLGKVVGPNPLIIYMGLGLILILLSVNLYYVVQGTPMDDISGLSNKLDTMMEAIRMMSVTAGG